MLSPSLELLTTPWEREHSESISTEVSAYTQYLFELPLGQYVKRVYTTERNARVDWRGI